MKKALLLSGGSVKGCFQAGAIKAAFELGFIPDIIYGTSVGALNGSFIANLAGKTKVEKGRVDASDWVSFGKQLCDFWTSEIKVPNDVAIKRSVIGDGLGIALNRFKGLSDTSPIEKKIDQVLDLNNLKNSPAVVKVATVDFNSSQLLFKKPQDDDFISYVKGSMSIPVAMPPCILGNQILFDGGTRDVAPISEAINEGAEYILGILCQSKSLNAITFNPGNVMQLAERMQDIIVNQNVVNDLQNVDFINNLLKETSTIINQIPTLKDKNYKLINHNIIQPVSQLQIEIDTFTANDIATLMQQGYDTAQSVLKGSVATAG